LRDGRLRVYHARGAKMRAAGNIECGRSPPRVVGMLRECRTLRPPVQVPPPRPVLHNRRNGERESADLTGGDAQIHS